MEIPVKEPDKVSEKPPIWILGLTYKQVIGLLRAFSLVGAVILLAVFLMNPQYEHFKQVCITQGPMLEGIVNRTLCPVDCDLLYSTGPKVNWSAINESYHSSGS